MRERENSAAGVPAMKIHYAPFFPKGRFARSTPRPSSGTMGRLLGKNIIHGSGENVRNKKRKFLYVLANPSDRLRAIQPKPIAFGLSSQRSLAGELRRLQQIKCKMRLLR
jgi:hypothetical protein